MAQIATATIIDRVSHLIKRRQQGHEDAMRSIRYLIGVIQRAREQRRRLTWAAGARLLVGCVPWSIFPGAVLRAFSASWHLSERMAAHIVGEPTLRDAGARLMKAGEPIAWRATLSADKMRRGNLDTITACERAAAKAGKSERCSILTDRQAF